MLDLVLEALAGFHQFDIDSATSAFLNKYIIIINIWNMIWILEIT